jgi:hypothetical protein
VTVFTYERGRNGVGEKRHSTSRSASKKCQEETESRESFSFVCLRVDIETNLAYPNLPDCFIHSMLLWLFVCSLFAVHLDTISTYLLSISIDTI